MNDYMNMRWRKRRGNSLNANNKNGESIMIELLMGMGFGSTVGYYTNNLGLGIVLGSFIGIVIGMFKIKRNKKYEQ